MIRAVILDFDGVLLESASVKTKAFATLFGEIAPERVPAVVAYHMANEGISRYVKFRYIYSEILHRSLSHEQEQALGRRFTGLVFTELLHVPLVAGAQAFLEAARKTYALFVASGTPEEELQLIARARHLFDLVREWHGAPKRKPDIIQDIMARHQFHPHEVVLVGDALSDRHAADEAGVMFAGRVSGSEDRLAGCQYQMTDLLGLPAVLERLEDGQTAKESIP